MNPFQAKTVAAAVAPLLKVLKNLEAVVTATTEAIKTNHLTIDRLQGENRTADHERVQAGLIIESLSGIISPKE